MALSVQPTIEVRRVFAIWLVDTSGKVGLFSGVTRSSNPKRAAENHLEDHEIGDNPKSPFRSLELDFPVEIDFFQHR